LRKQYPTAIWEDERLPSEPGAYAATSLIGDRRGTGTERRDPVYPIFALVGDRGDTAAILRDTGGAEMVAEDDVAAIEGRLREFIAALRGGRAPCVRPGAAERFSRREGAKLLGGLLDKAVAEHMEPPH